MLSGGRGGDSDLSVGTCQGLQTASLSATDVSSPIGFLDPIFQVVEQPGPVEEPSPAAGSTQSWAGVTVYPREEYTTSRILTGLLNIVFFLGAGRGQAQFHLRRNILNASYHWTYTSLR